MAGTVDALVTWSSYAGLVVLMAAMVMAFVRLLVGPSFPDRIVALDTAGYLAIGFCAIWAVMTGHDAFLDAAATLALISFLSTMVLARWVRRGDPEVQ